MSTLTTRLALKRNDGTDPFLRQDFIDNWNKLDLAPGAHICTSGSRPVWTSDQAGRQIFETDTMRTIFWTGTIWREQLQVGPAWGGALTVNALLNNGATGTYTLGTITTTRPGTVLVLTTCRVAVEPVNSQIVTFGGMIGGTVNTLGAGNASLIQWSDSNYPSVSYDHRMGTVHSWKAVSAGAHVIAIRVVVGTVSTQPCYVGGFAYNAFLVNSTAT